MTSSERRTIDERLQAAIDLYQSGHLQQAIDTMRALLRKQEASPKAWGYFGFLLFESRQIRPAANAFRRAVELSPESERASLGLFFALCRLGRFTDALKEAGRFANVGKPVRYIEIMQGTASELGVATDWLPEAAELTEIEMAYLEVEQSPASSLVHLAGADSLEDLVNA